MAILIRNGFGFRSCALPDGQRAILDILIPGDVGGLEHFLLARSTEDISAVGRVAYQVLSAAEMRDLLRNNAVSLQVLALVTAGRRRCDRLAASIGRLDAEARISVLLLDLYDRLRRHGLIDRPTFNVPLTQEQIADHLGLTLVHVNRTLRKLREAKVVLVDRQVVIIMDLDRLRSVAQGLPQAANSFEPIQDAGAS
jgi:CRP-like cAMP-binding protein